MACDDQPSAPPPGETPLEVVRLVPGDTVRDSVAAGDSVRVYRFLPGVDGFATLFLQALRSTTSFTVHDSASAGLLGRGSVSLDSSATLMDARTSVFPVVSNAPARVEARPLLVSLGSAFRLVLHRIDPAPEHRPATVALGDTVRGERLETSADIDRFVLDGQHGDEFLIFLQPSDSLRLDAVTLRLADPRDSAVVSMSNVERGRDPELHSSGTIVLAVAGRYVMEVSGRAFQRAENVSPAGDYNVELYPVERAPEGIGSAVVAGDTVAGEAIDRVGDVDEFTVTATAGADIRVFFQNLAADSNSVMVLETASDTGSPPAAVASVAGDPDLFDQVTDIVSVPGGGQVALGVRGASDTGSRLDRGSYRFLVHEIDVSPETAPVTVLSGDTVVEALEPRGDVDVFQYAGAAGMTVDLRLEVLAGFTGGAVLRILAPGGSQPLRTITVFSFAPIDSVAELVLPVTGWYVVRVAGEGPLQPGRGPYEFVLTER